MSMPRDARRAYKAGYLVAARRAAREIAELKAQLVETREALAEWRTAVEQRRHAERALVDFHRSILAERRGILLH